MPISQNIENLIINKVENQQVYDYMVENNLIKEDELYFVQGEGVTVDSELDPTSEHPIQNKVVFHEIDSLKKNKADINHEHTISDIENLEVTLDGKANSSHGHTIAGITGLQEALNSKPTFSLENGKVPASILPSYVDDVLEYANKTTFPAKGESGKIYVDTSTNKTYRWSGSEYVEISESLALGRTESTAFPGNAGAILEDKVADLESEIASPAHKHTIAQVTGLQAALDNKADNSHSHTIGDSTTSGFTKLYTETGTNTDGTMTQNAINNALINKSDSDHSHDEATSLKKGFLSAADKTKLDGIVAITNEQIDTICAQTIMLAEDVMF